MSSVISSSSSTSTSSKPYNFQAEIAKTHSIALSAHKVQRTMESLRSKFIPQKMDSLGFRTVSSTLPSNIQRLIDKNNEKAALEKLLKNKDRSPEENYQLARFYEWGSFKKGTIDIQKISFENAYQSYHAAAQAGHEKAIQKLQFWGFIEGGVHYSDKAAYADDHIKGITAAEINRQMLCIIALVTEDIDMSASKDNSCAFMLLSNMLPAAPKPIFALLIKHELAIVLDSGFMIGDKKFIDYGRAKDYFGECSKNADSETYTPLNEDERKCCSIVRVFEGFRGQNAKCLGDMFLEGKLGRDGQSTILSAASHQESEPAPKYDIAFIWYQNALRLGYKGALHDIAALLRGNFVSARLYPHQDNGLHFFQNLDSKTYGLYTARFTMTHFYYEANWPAFLNLINTIPIQKDLILIHIGLYDDMIVMAFRYYLEQMVYNDEFVKKAKSIIEIVETQVGDITEITPQINRMKLNLYRYNFTLKGDPKHLKRALECNEIAHRYQPNFLGTCLTNCALLHQVDQHSSKFTLADRKFYLNQLISTGQEGLKMLPESNYRYYRDVKKELHAYIAQAYDSLFKMNNLSKAEKENYFQNAIAHFENAATYGSGPAHYLIFELNFRQLRDLDETQLTEQQKQTIKLTFEKMMDHYDFYQDEKVLGLLAYFSSELYLRFGDIVMSKDQALHYAAVAARFSNRVCARVLFLEYTQGMSLEARQAFGITKEEISAWLQESADLGYSFALVEVAHQKLSAAKSLDSSTDANQLRQEAIAHYEQALQENASNLSARRALGFFALKGKYGVLSKGPANAQVNAQANYEKAIELLKPVSLSGDSQANLILGILCEQEILKEEAKVYFDRVKNYTIESYHRAKTFLGFEAESFDYVPFEKLATPQASSEITPPASAPERILTLDEELEVAQDFYAEKLKPEDLALLFSLNLSKEIKGANLMRILTSICWDCSDDDNKFKFKAPRGQVFGTHRKHDKDQGVVDIQFVKEIRNYLISVALEQAPQQRVMSTNDDDDGDA